MEQVTPSVSGQSPFNFRDFISFRKMIALQLIQVLYVVVAIIITLSALALMFKGNDPYSYSSSFMPGGFFGGLLFLVLGNVFWRLWCEFFIVLFRINNTLTKIEDNTQKQLPSAS